jgi:hypothetical protein
VLVFNIFFKKSKLCFGDRVVVLNNFFYNSEGVFGKRLFLD